MRGGYRLSYKELEVYKYFNGFDPRYLGHNLYLPLIARRLNNYHYTKFFEDKGLLGHLSRTVEFPHCIVRCIDGEYYDDEFKQISKASAYDIVSGHKGKLVFKLSRGSSGGHGVQIIELSSDTDPRQQAIKLMNTFGKDYVVQEAICQHEMMARFNPSSVNTLRIATLYLNGAASLCWTILRIGKDGAFVDNMSSGGMGVGVDRFGKLHDFGYDYACHQIHEINNIRFAGVQLEFIPRIIEYILKKHVEEFSLCKFIGWDVCVSEEGKIIIIEVNSSQPGIFQEQLCMGPVFGDRTEEVIEYVKRKEFKYNRGLLNF